MAVLRAPSSMETGVTSSRSVRTSRTRVGMKHSCVRCRLQRRLLVRRTLRSATSFRARANTPATKSSMPLPSHSTSLYFSCPRRGTYQPFEGQTSCYAAPPGSYIDVSGATEIEQARPCPGGTYSTGGAAACTDAPPGTAPGNFNGGWGATDVVNCNPGTTSPGGQYSCDPAPPGSYEPYYGEASPFTCAAGTYQPGYGATACILADVDHYVPGEGATSELSCPAGTHQPVTGSSSCLLDQTITFVAPADQVVGATLALEATATSGLPVEFTSLTPIVCSVTGSSVTANSTGTCTLQVGQAGDSTWNAAAPSEQSFAVTAVTTTSITSSPATPVVGQPVTYTATIAVVPPGSGTPTGAVTFTGNSGPLCTSPLNQSTPDTASCTTTYTSLLPAASDTVSAAYAGDGNFLYSTSPLLTVPITQAANTTSLTVDDANPVVGQSVTFTATVAVERTGGGHPDGHGYLHRWRGDLVRADTQLDEPLHGDV